MKLQDMKKAVASLRAERDNLHEELHALLAEDSITAGERNLRETAIRQRIKEINDECFPMEVVTGKVRKIAKGVEMEPQEAEIYQQCVEAVGGVEL